MKELPHIAGYEILGFIGEGGMGAVFKALQTSTGKHVAIKFLLANSAELLARFRREVHIAKELDHPNIVKILDAGGMDGNEPYIVMEFLDGKSLCSRINDGNLLSSKECETILQHMSRALCHIHDSGALHRDIKPSNIILERSGRTVLIDFGLARGKDSEHSRLTKTGQVVGTIATIAPEVLSGEKATPASDIFSLGVSLYEATTGKLPYASMLLLAAGEEIPKPKAIHKLRNDFPESLSRLIQRCLAPKHCDRLHSSKELLDLAKGLGRAEKAHRSSSSKPIGLYLSLIALLCALLFVFMEKPVRTPRREEIILMRDRMLSAKRVSKEELERLGARALVREDSSVGGACGALYHLASEARRRKRTKDNFRLLLRLVNDYGPFCLSKDDKLLNEFFQAIKETDNFHKGQEALTNWHEALVEGRQELTRGQQLLTKGQPVLTKGQKDEQRCLVTLWLAKVGLASWEDEERKGKRHGDQLHRVRKWLKELLRKRWSKRWEALDYLVTCLSLLTENEFKKELVQLMEELNPDDAKERKILVRAGRLVTNTSATDKLAIIKKGQGKIRLAIEHATSDDEKALYWLILAHTYHVTTFHVTGATRVKELYKEGREVADIALSLTKRDDLVALGKLMKSWYGESNDPKANVRAFLSVDPLRLPKEEQWLYYLGLMAFQLEAGNTKEAKYAQQRATELAAIEYRNFVSMAGLVSLGFGALSPKR